MKWICYLLLQIGLFIFTAHAQTIVSNGAPVIYGDDDRIEVNLHPNQCTQALAQKVAGQIWNRQLIPSTQGKDLSYFVKESLSSVYNICEGEKFSDQNILPRCSGFLIKEDILLTAAHCLESSENFNNPQEVCEQTSWVFNYDSQRDFFHNDDIYQCEDILVYSANRDEDYALIKLKKPAVKAGLSLSFKTASIDDEVFSIGHGLFLPKQIYGGARITGIQEGYYLSNLDTFMGNSGSPVFSKNTNHVIGMIVGGGDDFILNEEDFCLEYARKSNKAEDAEEEILSLKKIESLLRSL